MRLLPAVLVIGLVAGSFACGRFTAQFPRPHRHRGPTHILSFVNTDDEACFISFIQAARAHALPLDPTLTQQARAHSQAMADAGTIFHSGGSPSAPEPSATVVRAAYGPPVSTSQKMGENVGMGSSCGAINPAFQTSSPHWANIIDPAWTEMGVGAVETPATPTQTATVYVTEVFMEVAPPPAPAPQPKPTPLPSPKGCP